MRPDLPAPSTLLPAVSAGVVALGVAVNGGFAPSVRTIPALVLLGAGLFGVVGSVADRSVDAVRAAAERWWAIALAAFVPYGLATAPSSESAAAVGAALPGAAVAALEAIAGAAVLSAVAVTALYGVASYGVHPGRPTPEERVLDDRGRSNDPADD